MKQAGRLPCVSPPSRRQSLPSEFFRLPPTLLLLLAPPGSSLLPVTGASGPPSSIHGCVPFCPPAGTHSSFTLCVLWWAVSQRASAALVFFGDGAAARPTTPLGGRDRSRCRRHSSIPYRCFLRPCGRWLLSFFVRAPPTGAASRPRNVLCCAWHRLASPAAGAAPPPARALAAAVSSRPLPFTC
jgi:hypothetical protein